MRREVGADGRLRVLGRADDVIVTGGEKVGAAEVFATIFQAVGIDHKKDYHVGSRPVPLSDVDLRTVPMTMRVDDEVASTGSGAACLGNPLHAARWLADVMSGLGTPLRAGECVMTGALGPMQPIAAGSVVHADLGPLGTVTTRLGA